MQYGNAEKEIKAEYTTKCPVDDDYNCGQMKMWMINASTRRCETLLLYDGIGKCPALWLIHNYAVIYWLRSLHLIICNPVEPSQTTT